MQVVIDIPKEFEDQFKGDKFADTFARVLMDIEPPYKLAGNYEKETLEMLYKAFQKAITLQEHGDLIDKDELELDSEWNDYEDGFISYSQLQINNAPIIIGRTEVAYDEDGNMA